MNSNSTPSISELVVILVGLACLAGVVIFAAQLVKISDSPWGFVIVLPGLLALLAGLYDELHPEPLDDDSDDILF